MQAAAARAGFATGAPPRSGARRWLAAPAGLALVLALGATRVAAEEQEESSRVAIRFADLNGVEDWSVAADGSLIIEGRNGARFRATFFGSCPGVRFANSIGFVTDPTGDLDRFSSIIVDGERCYFRSLEKLDPEQEAGGATE